MPHADIKKSLLQAKKHSQWLDTYTSLLIHKPF